ncbi:ABC transporter substrate-binding protein [Aliamphritea spongicola]|uniref:ABC transporter substrate-binding protein n=1 Tax=Aliamphritea spongicola TaxID=707589 RepID=UPI00196AA10C|nr:ABC transporter substrate binding protein [Aliamphritea spongicola]MBN3563603.1 ABC transporter substrate-binding protein [Aliamphritea spongicola]
MLIRTFITLLLGSILFIGGPAAANTLPDFSSAPATNNGKPWRIGYLEGGEYIYYRKIFTATIRAMMQRGWLEAKPLPETSGEQTADLWHWLSEEASGRYIHFVPDAHYSAGWDDDRRKSVQQAVLSRLNEQQDIDLMIAAGTWAGQDLANDHHATNTLIISTSNPLSAGIVKSADDSGFDHVHARVDPDRYLRQLRVFHDLVGFRRLGIALEDSDAGRSYAGWSEAQRLAKRRGFTLVPCYTLSDISDTRQAEASVIDCFKTLVKNTDAIYVTTQGGITDNSLPRLISIVNQHKIPTFSQNGGREVRQGILMSISQAGHRAVGDFHAMTMGKIFNGAKPNQLPQLFVEPVRMAVNLKSAELVGYQPPLLLLGASDEIYRTIP